MKTKVNLTSEFINNGHPCSSSACPIALALKPALKADCDIIVGPYHLNLLDWADDEGMSIALPPIAAEFILTFDGRETRDKAEPISFDIDIPEKYLKQTV